MAIIYTYPKLQDPQGNELIVVSDVNNKNATRLITIADIASLIPSGGGCNSAIAGILTGAGNYIPPLCNQVTFTGSGIDISADQATATVTFTATPYELPCADLDTLGGIKASQITGVQPPEPASTGDYYPVQTLTEIDPDFNCTAVVRIPDSQSYQLPCATDSVLGGIKAQDNQSETSVPGVAASGTYYPIELIKNNGAVTGAECTAIVKVPSGGDPFQLTCATPTTLGGIKASSIATAVPDPANSGDYYPVQITSNDQDDDCTAVVRVPLTGATITATQSAQADNNDPNLTVGTSDVKVTGGAGVGVLRNSDTQITISQECASVNTIGGIKAGSVNTALPAPANEGTYYPIQVLDDEVAENECRAVVRIPDPETPATPGNGQIEIVAGTGLTGGGTFTVNQAGPSTITLNAESTAAETGWSPMTITEGATTLDVQPDNSLTIFYHATADATFDLNTIKMMLPEINALGGANKDEAFSVALYDGSLTNLENGGPAATLINEWQYTPGGVAVFGIKEIVSETTCSITAGKDYVIGVSVINNGPLLLGDGVQIIDQNPGTPNIFFGPGSNFINSPYLGSGNNNLYGDNGAAWPATLSVEGNFSSSWRYSIHFYFTQAATEIRQYTKCPDVDANPSEGCAAMDPSYVVQAPADQLEDFLILTDGTNQCCYVKGDIVTAPPTATIVQPFDDCGETALLKEGCITA